ncbi:MAG: type VI secretion system Vgr family protein [Sandaracinaceae bacterium]
MALDLIRFRFSSDGLAGVPLEVHDLTLDERLDEPYVATLRIGTTTPDVDPAPLLGRNVELVIERLPVSRRVLGVVRSVSEGLQSPSGVTLFDVEVVPALWMSSLRRNTRMFQGKTAIEIVQAVLGDALGPYGRSVRDDTNDTYAPREYCMQYQETDLAFVQRILQEEGVRFSFEHEGSVETMVLSDSNGTSEPVVTEPAPGVLPFEAGLLVVRDAEPIHRIERARNRATTAVTIRDFDWTQVRTIHQEAPGSDDLGITRESYEHGEGRSLRIGSYDQGVRRYQAHDAARQAPVRKEGFVQREVTLRGVGRAVGLAPGVRFTLRGHPTVGFDDDYLVTRVVHRSGESPELAEAGGTEPYHVVFECQPLSVAYRPERVYRKPRIPSMQTAIVTGPSGEEIHTDEWGRVKVQFYWDRENPHDDSSSTWVRVSQAWAGAGWGAMWIPRVGFEVVVQFVDGDPDRPVVTGALYNGNNPTPYELPAEKSKSTIKSNSYPGGGGFNEIRFEDRSGAEEIYIHAQKDYNRVTLNNETHTIGNNQSISVGVDQTVLIGSNQSTTVGLNQTLAVGVDQSIDVGANHTEHVGGNSTVTIDGNLTTTVNTHEERTVNAGRDTTINAFDNLTINGPYTEHVTGPVTINHDATYTHTIGASATVNIGGDTMQLHGGSLTQTISGATSILTSSTYFLTSLGAYTLFVPAGGTVVAPAGWNVITPASFWKKQGISASMTGLNIALTGASLTATGAVVSVTGISVAGTGVSIAANLVSVSGSLLKSKTFGVQAKKGGPTINLYAVAIQTTAIFICC